MALVAHSDWAFGGAHHLDGLAQHQLEAAAHHHHWDHFTDLTSPTVTGSVASVLKTLWHQTEFVNGGSSPSIGHHNATSTNAWGTAVAPTLTVADSALHVDAGGSVALPISVAPSSAGHATSVTITGVADYQSVTDNLDHKIFTGNSITLTAAEVNSGLTLASNPSPALAATDPQNTLSVTASETFGDHTLTSAAQTITVTDPPPLRLSIGSASANEGGDETFTVTLSKASTNQVTVNYTTKDGTALAGTDYTATSGTLTFTAGTTSQTVTVHTLNDNLTNESNESFTVALSSPANAKIGTGTGTGTIVPVAPTTPAHTPSTPSSTPSLSIGNASANEGGLETFTVTLSQASTSQVTVAYATQDGTALHTIEPGATVSDYNAANGTLTFAAGQTTQTITVQTNDDHLANEPANPTFTVALAGASGASIATGSGTGTITSAAVTPSLSLGNASANEGGVETFTVTLSQASLTPVTVAYATQDGTAHAGTDYTAASGTLTFAPGVTSQHITVQTINDNLANEANETFTVALANPTNATLSTATGTGTIVQVAPTTGTTSTPEFTAANGVITAPDGSNFVARGVDVFALGGLNLTNDAPTIVSQFPGINFIRLASDSGDVGQGGTVGTIANLDPFIQYMTSRHIVVEIEDHNGNVVDPNIPTGTNLTNEYNWYANFAAYYKNNPYVWFGTMNEPIDNSNGAALVAQEVGIYNAIRSAGNNSPVMLELEGGYYSSNIVAGASSYSTMTNTVWDVHLYANAAGSGSTTQSAMDTAIQNHINPVLGVHSADGQMPVIIGEYGPQTGPAPWDTYHNLLIQAVQQDFAQYGSAAWAWDGYGANDSLTVSEGGALNSWGNEVKTYIQTGVTNTI
jgi:hypothetical protein